jgi:hypothetical protein
MQNSFSNRMNDMGTLGSYLGKMRSDIARVNRVTGQTLNKQDNTLFQVHADKEPGRRQMLLNEMDRASGAIDETGFLNKNNKIQGDTPLKGHGGNESLFKLSEKQLWSSFAREITKALKRNI